MIVGFQLCRFSLNSRSNFPRCHPTLHHRHLAFGPPADLLLMGGMRYDSSLLRIASMCNAFNSLIVWYFAKLHTEVWTAPSEITRKGQIDANDLEWREKMFCVARSTQMAITIPLEVNKRKANKTSETNTDGSEKAKL